MVQRQQLMANEVISGRQQLGDYGLPGQVLYYLVVSPVCAAKRVCGHAFLINLSKRY
jgi:hypothetical protein